MDEMGHTDPGLALRVYRQAMRRGEDEQEALRALVEGRSVLGQEPLDQLRDSRIAVEGRWTRRA